MRQIAVVLLGLLAKADHHVDARDLVAFRRMRRLADDLFRTRDIDQRVLTLDEKVVMRGGVGVEIGFRAVDHDLAPGVYPDMRERGAAVMLIYGAHFAEDLKDARRFGWQVPSDCEFDWKCLQENVLAEVDRINKAYTQTIENSGAEIILQRATVSGPKRASRAHQRMRCWISVFGTDALTL